MKDLLLWSENLAIGHPGLDTEHRHMLDLINEVITVVGFNGDPSAQLKTLRGLAVEHVGNENRILWQLQAGTLELLQEHPGMRKILKMMARSRINDHMTEHHGFLARLDVIVRNGANTLCEELRGWFLDHALSYDAGLKEIFETIR